MSNLDTFNGNFIASDGSIHNLDGSIVSSGEQLRRAAFNGNFFDSTGAIRNIDSLGAGAGTIILPDYSGMGSTSVIPNGGGAWQAPTNIYIKVGGFTTDAPADITVNIVGKPVHLKTIQPHSNFSEIFIVGGGSWVEVYTSEPSATVALFTIPLIAIS
jgi:hypothetical protein